MRGSVIPTKNILFAGIGGQGTILASEITCQVLMESQYDVKKSEVHGMSQRGGSVKSDIRFGSKVYSPIIPDGETDIFVAFHDSELERNLIFLKPDGIVIRIEDSDKQFIPHAKVSNLFLIGKLSCHLPVETKKWEDVIKQMVPPAFLDQNLTAFRNGVKRGHA
ncbi:MAG: indolepyruvate oxidoreductase subunit beta [Candidatus Auribacterota bacterium]